MPPAKTTAGERLRLSDVETGTRHVISTGETKKIKVENVERKVFDFV